ncbi:hypothetical protein BC628DRAFT_1399251 [Trametes gibbosa]|nr:hypothetical protein BC628DRAFT_1399251 [Trametes gibbosa]
MRVRLSAALPMPPHILLVHHPRHAQHSPHHRTPRPSSSCCRERLPTLPLPCAMRPPQTLLLLLAFAALVAAQSAAECKDGLDKLKNKSGMSPCTVGKQLMQACNANSSSSDQCQCNTVTYNLGAACAACSGDGPPNWAQWADDHSCESNPQQFPSNVDIEHGIIPQWAYLPLTTENDFNIAAAVLDANGTGATRSSRSNVATQVAVPIAAGVGVALIATLIFWLYWRRHTRNPRMKSLPLIPGSQRAVWRPWRYLQTLWSRARSRRLHQSKKDSGWAIEAEEDTEAKLLTHSRVHSRASYLDPYSTNEVPLVEEPLELEEMDVPHTSAHLQETSSSSLLPHLEFPSIRVPTIFERLIKSKDGVRKSPAYKAKYVSPVSPDAQFLIDGSAGPTHIQSELADAQSPPPSSGRHSGQGTGARGDGVSGGSPQTQPIVTEPSDFEPQSEGVGSSVLLISRTGEDFSLDDGATIVPSHSHPSSPQTPSTFRQVSRLYDSHLSPHHRAP